MLTLLTQTLNAICRPNPAQYPPQNEETKQLFHLNRLSLTVLFTMLMIPILLLPFITFSRSFNIIRIGTLFLMLVVFIITCRSYRTIGLIVISALVQVITTYLICLSEGVYYQLSVAYITPIALYLVTNNLYVSAFSAISHAILLVVKFRPNLLYAILTTDPEVFVDNFVRGFVVSFVMIETIYLMIFTTLKKRTVELSKATKAAREALEQQKTFVYSFSHEMRNPMNSLLGNLDLVLMSNLPAEIRNMLNTARTCGVLLLNHINTILDVGKMELAKLEVKPTPTKIHDFLQRMWTISYDLVAQKGLRYHLKIEKKAPPLLMLDSHRLSQILLNLIGNATKFTQRGSIGITVQWAAGSTVINDECFEPKPYDDEDEGIFEKEENISFCRMNSFDRDSLEYLVLSQRHKEFDLQDVIELNRKTSGILKIIVKDTGCGISKEELPKLFQKFSQVGTNASQRSMGTGLGLYISKEICKNMNGDIRVYSKPKTGTTFIICIPTTALPIHQHPHFVSDSARVIEALKAKKLKVIVADDSPFNVNLVSNFCYKFDAKVIAATHNGRSAYEKYVQSVRQGVPVDLVTLDIDMPVMDGKEACERIRQYERENHIKPAIIMLISGNYEAQQVTNMIGDSQNRRADSFMRKPLVFSEFYWNVYKIIFPIEI